VTTRADANKELVSRFIHQFKNRGDLGALDELTTPDFVHHLHDPRIPVGREGSRAVRAMLGVALPDLEVTVHHLVADGDVVAEHSSGRGTHRAELFGVPATGRELSWSELHVYRIQGDRIAEHWPLIDFGALWQQLGLVRDAREAARAEVRQ
jgi:predicted ester cyclase